MHFYSNIYLSVHFNAKHRSERNADNNRNNEEDAFNGREYLIQNPQLIPLNPLLIIDR